MILDFRMLAAALLLALPLVACSSQGADLPMMGSSSPPDETTAYRLGPGDKLDIKVFGGEDLSGEYPVSDSGTISMPLIGEVKAGGLSPSQLEQEIRDKLERGYIKNPRVNVAVLSYRPFYIYGEVTKPGEYPYASGMRVRNAVATAGGYTYRANQNYVVVDRHGVERRADDSTPIEPDDVIKVPERYF